MIDRDRRRILRAALAGSVLLATPYSLIRLARAEGKGIEFRLKDGRTMRIVEGRANIVSKRKLTTPPPGTYSLSKSGAVVIGKEGTLVGTKGNPSSVAFLLIIFEEDKGSGSAESRSRPVRAAVNEVTGLRAPLRLPATKQLERLQRRGPGLEGDRDVPTSPRR